MTDLFSDPPAVDTNTDNGHTDTDNAVTSCPGVTADNLLYITDWLLDPERTREEARALLLAMIDDEPHYLRIIDKGTTLKKLRALFWMSSSRDKKSDFVARVYRNALQGLARLDAVQYSPFSGESFAGAIAKQVDKQFTPEVWETTLGELRAERDAMVEARKAKARSITNPQTLDDYVLRIRARGLDSLDAEQLATYDALFTANAAERRAAHLAARANRLSIDLEGAAFDLIDTHHTQKGHALFVVQFTEWLPRRLWLSAYERARDFGGWYSGYDVGDAIPGLQFKDDEQRRLFCESVLCGGQQLEQYITEARRLAKLRACDRLRDMADKMEAKSADILATDRKINTPRRARLEETRQETHRDNIARARTLRKIADTIELDAGHVLAGLRFRTDFETLRAVGMEWPKYRLTADAAAMLYHASKAAGADLLPRMINKRLREAKSDNVEWNDRMSELAMNAGISAWWLFNTYTHRQRLTRMGICSAPELRHAQRQLETLTAAPEAEPAWKALEREIIGANYAGFFPTPAELVRELCDMAGVTDADKVMDPSAGKGDILAAVIDRHNVAGARGVEIVPRLGELCRARGLDVVTGDALTADYSGASVILMNPPFEGTQALDHLRHAYQQADAGTRIAAIMPASITTRSDASRADFREWLKERGAMITANPPHAFRGAFRSTDVDTVNVLLTK